MTSGWHGSARCAVIAVALLAACTRSGTPVTAPAAPGAGPRVVSTVSGEVDVLAGTLTFARVTPSADAGATAQAVIPVVQDGFAGSGPPDTVELVTERSATVALGCGTVDGFEADVRMRSFFAGYELRDTYVVIDQITPTGREACNSAPPAGGLSDAQGLFSYGTLVGSGASAAATWRFRVPDSTQFRFVGHVIADVVDAAPPVTLATPPGGVFDAALLVSLACTDAGGGCAATHYTVDGSEPTAASPLALAPIPVTTTTTIRYFSVDAAGNPEAPRSETYVVDTVPPTVAGVAPYDGQGDVATGAVLRVTFSEPVDPATVPGAITLGVPGRAVAGTVAPESGSTWTFTPAAPLDPATRHTLAVSTAVRDPAGHPLAAAHASWFVTVTPSVVVSGPGSANLVNRGTAEDASGNRLAVFSANTYLGAKLLWSYRPAATGVWSAPQAIYSGKTIAPPELPLTAQVAASGSRFLVAWQNPRDAALETAVFNGGTPGAVKKHWALRYDSAPALGVVGNGSGGFAVVGSDYNSDRVYGAVFDGTSWIWDSGSVDARTARASAPAVASRGGNNYVAAYRAGNPPTAIYTSRYTYSSTNGTGSWAATALPGASGSATMLPPAIAATSTQTAVAWGTASGTLYASVATGTGAFGAGSILGSTTSSTTALSAAANGTRLAVSWDKYGSTYEYDAAYARWYWSGQGELTSKLPGYVASGAVVAPGGGGFVAALRTNDVLGDGIGHVTANKDVYGAWFTWSNQVLAESWAEDARGLLVSGAPGTAPAILSWVRDDGTAPHVAAKTYDGATLGVEERPSGEGVPGHVGGSARLARNAAGDVLAAWHQEDGGSSGVFAARRVGGVWQPAVRLARRAVEPEVASDGTGFLVVYRDTSSGTSTITAIEYSGGSWGAPAALGAGSARHVVASEGTTYAVLWESGTTVQFGLKGGSGWTLGLSPAGGTGTSSRPAVALGHDELGRNEYLFAWYLDAGLGSRSIVTNRAVITDGARNGFGFTGVQTVFALPYGVAVTGGPVLASNAGGYAIAWSDGVAARAARRPATTWAAPVTLVPSGSCVLPALAASASGWLAAFDCGGVRLASYDAGAWGGVMEPGLSASELAVASDGSRYKVLARVADGASTSLVQLDVRGGTAFAPTTLASGTSPTTAPVAIGAAVLHDGADWVGAWVQQGDPIANLVKARTAF